MSPGNYEADAVAIRHLIEAWAKAVRAKDYPGILARHSADMLMFDVPPPAESRGLEAYRRTWDFFFSAQPDPIAFDIQQMDIVAGADVSFVTARMQCAEMGEDGERVALEFRLTVGLRKLEGKWMVLHEHHSVPATWESRQRGQLRLRGSQASAVEGFHPEGDRQRIPRLVPWVSQAPDIRRSPGTRETGRIDELS